mmetsp:Transcript_24552/g.39970  ORF Transcript_24552/g.39970 Transcript_24552/m.39970 type:complete len:203 (+) Transcript_24552:140-748(+)
MKFSHMITIAATVATAAADGNLFKTLSDADQERALFTYSVVFEECVGRLLPDCEAIIAAQVAQNPSIFALDGGNINFDVLPVRNPDSPDYFKVALRTDQAETHVTGILGDGMVWYPYQWCTEVGGTGCVNIGPWDCDVGLPLTIEQCCNAIKVTVPLPDHKGNYLDCHPDPPIGSVSNPIDYSRVRIHVDTNNIVVHAPKNE